MSMKTQEKLQNDLFGDVQGIDQKIKKKSKFLFPHIQNSIPISYENMVFIIIGFLMTCIICFSLGVEKGRYDIISERNRRVGSEAKREFQSKIAQKKEPIATEKGKDITNVNTSKSKDRRGR